MRIQFPKCLCSVGDTRLCIEFRIAVIAGVVAAHYSVISVYVSELHGAHLDNRSYYRKFGKSVLA